MFPILVLSKAHKLSRFKQRAKNFRFTNLNNNLSRQLLFRLRSRQRFVVLLLLLTSVIGCCCFQTTKFHSTCSGIAKQWTGAFFKTQTTPAFFYHCHDELAEVLFNGERHLWRHLDAEGKRARTTSLSSSVNDEDDYVDGLNSLSLLEDLLRPSKSCCTKRMSGTDLAYIGDVVFELFVRSLYVWPPKRTADLQNKVVACVRAENQSRLVAKLKEEFPLDTKEQQILSRGRNASSKGSGNRRDPAAYQDSTAFEALVGYLYIDNQKRCGEILNWLLLHIEDAEL